VQASPVSANAAQGPFRPGDHWIGTYSCAQGPTRADLQIVSTSANRITDAIFKFDFTPHIATGVEPSPVPPRTGAFHISGGFDSASLSADLAPGAWIVRPDESWAAVGMRGRVELATMTFTGAITGPGCGSFSVQRADESAPSPAPSAPAPAATPPGRFETRFNYEVRFGDGVRTYNENADQLVPVWLPPDQGWQCNRNIGLIADGRKRNGFGCSNDGWKTDVLIIVGCKPTALDPLHGAGMRLFAPRPDGRRQGEPVDGGSTTGFNPAFGKYVDVAVSCETVGLP
jgi:hypothetical protein